MDSSITIRRVKAGDGPALYDFFDLLSPASKRTFAPFGPNPTLDQYEEVVLGNAPASETKYDLVAVNGAEIIGWSFVWALHSTAPHEPVFGLGVADPYHGQGVGSRLMDSVLEAMRMHGMPKLYLTVVTDNDKAWQMYSRRGFVRYDAFTGADGLAYYRMALDFGSLPQSAASPQP